MPPFQRQDHLNKPQQKHEPKVRSRFHFGPATSLSSAERETQLANFRGNVSRMSREELVTMKNLQREAALAGRSISGDSQLDLLGAHLVQDTLQGYSESSALQEQNGEPDLSSEFEDESGAEASAMVALSKNHHVPLADIQRRWKEAPEKHRAMAGMGPRRRNIVKQAQDLKNEAASELDADGNSAYTPM